MNPFNLDDNFLDNMNDDVFGNDISLDMNNFNEDFSIGSLDFLNCAAIKNNIKHY